MNDQELTDTLRLLLDLWVQLTVEEREQLREQTTDATNLNPINTQDNTMTPDQLLTARLIRLSELRESNPRDRFTFKGSILWTDGDGITWLRDHWGHLLPVPHVRAQENTP